MIILYKLLIVEDESKTRASLITCLPWVEMGITSVHEASNGRKALDMAKVVNPDLVITDIRMPEMDGLEATQVIRQQSTHQPVIIAVTANALQDDKDACTKAGMDDYVSKPIEVDKLMTILEKWAIIIKQKTEV